MAPAASSPPIPATVSPITAAPTVPPGAAPRLPFSAFVGLRYLKPRRTFVSIITLVSIAGVVLGVALPIIVLAVMTGFDQELHNKVLGFDPHIEVTQTGGLLDNWRQVRKEVANVPGVVASAPYIRGPVLVEANNQRVAAFIRGVDPELERHVTDLGGLMKPGEGRHAEGKFDLDGDKAVVGYDLAHLLGLGVGDKLTIISSKSLQKLTDALDQLKDKKATDQDINNLRELVAPAVLTVSGIFDSGRYQYDSAFVFVPFHVGQELYETEGAAHGVAIRVDQPYQAEAVKERLLAEAGSFARRADVDRPERAVLQRGAHGAHDAVRHHVLHPDRGGLLRDEHAHHGDGAEDARDRHHEGRGRGRVADRARVPLAGRGGGAVRHAGRAGAGAGDPGVAQPVQSSGWKHQFHVVVFAKQVYGFGRIPYFISPFDATTICVSAFVICSLAALIPAYFAARLDPVKALRFD